MAGLRVPLYAAAAVQLVAPSVLQLVLFTRVSLHDYIAVNQ
jgi:hypothetical protein